MDIIINFTADKSVVTALRLPFDFAQGERSGTAKSKCRVNFKIGYCEVWKERKEAAIAYSHKDWDRVSDEEVFAAAEQAKNLGFAV